MAYTKYSLTPANNTAAPPDGAPEGMLPSAVNDTMRDMMAQIRDVGDGIRDGTYTMTAPKITGGTITGSTINNSAIGGTTAAAGKFTTLEATGVATFSAGTVSAPAITTTGDTNTGIFFPAADTIAFTEGGAESMRITSDGEVLIGGTTSLNAANGCLTLQRTNDQPYLSFFRNDTSINPTNSLGDIYYYGNDTTSSAITPLAAIRVLATDTHAAGDNPTDIVFQTTPDGSATIAEAGRITQSGAYVLKGGNTSPSGTGITFPATQSASSDANTLDDYEEGTFTPLVSDGTNTASLGTSYYVKVGQLVHINVPAYSVSVSALTAGSALSITGLPFTKNVNFFAVIIAIYAGTDKTVSCGDGSGTTFNLYVPNSATDYTQMTRNTFGGAGNISFRFSVSYRTNS